MLKRYFKFFCLIIGISIILPQCVKASECTKEQVNLFNNLVNNIEIKYKHENNNIFSIEIYNIPKEIVVYDIFGNKFSYNEKGVSINNGYKGNTSYELTFLPNEWNCELPLSFRKSIYIKKYNLYSLKEECKNIDYTKFKYCNPYYQGKITDETFNTELQKYNLENEKVKNNNINENNKNKIFNDQKYYILFGGISILFIIVLILIIRKLIKNKRRKI